MKVALALLAATLAYKEVSAACFAEAQGYNCCKGCTVITSDESGIYQFENRNYSFC